MADALTSMTGQKILFVASTGGHLAQLNRLAQKIEPSPESLWVTFEKPQSVSMLAGRRHEFVPYVAPRDGAAVWRAMKMVKQIMLREHFDVVISTGSAVAISSHLPALRRGLRTVYVESVSRLDGPSLTGRILERVPRIELYAQHEGYRSSRWKHEFSVLDTYGLDEDWHPTSRPHRIFVTLGTISPYRFDSLVDKLLTVAPAETEFTWQVGVTDRFELPGTVVSEMSSHTFQNEAASSDLVVTHAGVGSVMELLDHRCPVLVVPRRKSRNEHVDDHQSQIAREIASRGIAVSSEVEGITAETLVAASRLRVR